MKIIMTLISQNLIYGGDKLDIGAMIKDYLENNGITQAFLSRKTGIEAPKLSMALNGTRKLSLDEYSVICGVLKVDTNFFLRPH